MKWFTKFWKRIADQLPASITPEALERLSVLDPQQIDVENVRSILGVSTGRARLICETAVRRGVFRRKVQVLCPDNSVAASAPTREELPPSVRCWQDIQGDLEPRSVPTEELQTREVFALNE
jgi:hypothetical protein